MKLLTAAFYTKNAKSFCCTELLSPFYQLIHVATSYYIILFFYSTVLPVNSMRIHFSWAFEKIVR